MNSIHIISIYIRDLKFLSNLYVQVTWQTLHTQKLTVRQNAILFTLILNYKIIWFFFYGNVRFKHYLQIICLMEMYLISEL